MINLIMPMGGRGERFSKDGIATPKPLIDLKGKPFFYWSTQSILQYTEAASLVFVVLKEHADKFGIDAAIRIYYPQAQFVYLEDVLNGAVLTCREGVKAIDNDYPVVFNDCDHLFYAPEFYEYCNTGDYSILDGALLTFKSNDPKFSYLKYGDDGYVIQTVEKKVVSDEAICGAYYFRNKDIFVKASDDYLQRCAYQEYFVSGVYNSLTLLGGKTKGFKVQTHLAFGTPLEYAEALKSEAAVFQRAG
ncbi:hypothetical protein AGMMS50293_27000 [Spirochaetia bacterium]|nr:hypothetical protein AGMMS50293_27000 [Spirochaetia bacterium]